MSAAPPEKPLPPVLRTVLPDGTLVYRLPDTRASLQKLLGALAIFLLLVAPLFLLLVVPLGELPIALAAAAVLVTVHVGMGVWLVGREVSSLRAPREVQVGPEVLTVISRLGPFEQRWLRAITAIDALVLRSAITREAELRILSPGSPDLCLVSTLSPAALHAFACQLADELTRRGPAAAAPVAVRLDTGPTPGEFGQPARSGIVVVEQGGGLCISIPPLRHNARHAILLLAAFGGFYVIAGIGYTIGVVLELLSSPATAALTWSRLEDMLGHGFGWLIGAFLVVVALAQGTRRIFLTAAPHGLQVEVLSLFRERRWAWRWLEIAEIRGDHLGFFIRPVQGKPLKLHWLATTHAEYHWLGDLLRPRWQAARQATSSAGPDAMLAAREIEP